MGAASGSRRRRLPGGRSPLIGSISVLVVIALLAWAPIARSQSTPALEVDVGFGGAFMPDRVTPVAVRIDHEGVPIDGELVVRQDWRPLLEAPRAIEARRPVTLGPKARLRYVFYLPLSGESPPNGESPELSVRLTANGQSLAERVIPLENARRGGLVLMASESGYLQELPTGEMTIQLAAEELPVDWRAYDGVRRLYLGRIDATRLDGEQRSAIRQWVAGGGDLVVLAGSNAYRQDADWLNDLSPFRVESVESRAAFGARVAIGSPRGEVRFREDDLPLLTHWRVGRGGVSFSSLSLSNAGPTQAAVWDRLAPGQAEPSGPFRLGTDLFRRMPLYYPDKSLIAGALAVYMVGVGLLMLATLRRAPWTSGGRSEASSKPTDLDSDSGASAGRNRLWTGLVAWIALGAALAIGYGGQSAFVGRVQSLEVGVMWASTRAGLTYESADLSLMAKRSLTPQWTLPAATAAVPLQRTDIALTDGGTVLMPLERPLPAKRIHDVAFATVEPLAVEAEFRDRPAVRSPQLRVYNRSHFQLEEAVVWHQGDYSSIGSSPIAPGERRAVDLNDLQPAAMPWVDPLNRPGDFTPQAKGAIFDAVDRRLRERGDPWALLAWVRAPGLPTHPDEYRETWRLLVVTPW